MLQSGTYSSGIMNKGLADECYLMTYSYYTSCSEDAHHYGEAADEDGGPCEAETQSVLVVTQALICPNQGGSLPTHGSNESGTTPGGFNPSGGGSGNPTDPSGSNGSNNPNQPCDGSGIPSQPQDPSSTLGNQPCNNGTVTLPNLGSGPNDPCEKLKTNLQKAKDIIEQTDVKNKNDIMKANIMSDVFEKAFYWGKDSSGTLKTSNIVDGTGGNVTFGISGSQFAPEAYIHNHNGTGGYMDFSSTDIYAFHTFSSAFSTLKHNYANGSDGSQYVMTLENKTEFNAFVAAYPISTVDVSTDTYEGSGDWIKGVDIRTDEDLVYDYFLKQGKTSNQTMDLTLGYLIGKYNMGIMISKKGTDGKFHPIQVEGVEITNSVTGEKEITYNSINPCNL